MIENYKNLACAIIKAAYDDYMMDYYQHGKFVADRNFKDFCHRSILFNMVDIDPVALFERAQLNASRKYNITGGMKNGKKKKNP